MILQIAVLHLETEANAPFRGVVCHVFIENNKLLSNPIGTGILDLALQYHTGLIKGYCCIYLFAFSTISIQEQSKE